MSRKGGTVGGGWVHPQVETSICVWAWLQKGTKLAISLLLCTNGLKQHYRASISGNKAFSLVYWQSLAESYTYDY